MISIPVPPVEAVIALSILFLATELARLPGIGRKTALRLTYHVLKTSSQDARRLADAIVAVSERVVPCDVCGSYTEVSPCGICSNPRRDPSIICVVEEASDVGPIEGTGEYRGFYHVLGGRLSPLDGIGPRELGLDLLADRLAAGEVQELIIATNPTVEGEATAHYLAQLARGHGVRPSRPAHGLPLGGELEYVDRGTLSHAFGSRGDMA